MKSVPRGMRTLVLCIALLLLPAASAEAARSSFPQGFYGVGYGGNVELTSASAQGKLWNRLAAAGAESTRVLFNWEIAQRTRNGPIDWSRNDMLVANAVKRNMSVLPVVEYAPRWAKQYPNKAQSPPNGTADYTKFLRAAIDRYGPGTLLVKAAFWRAHPELPYRPIREWEVWNEPEIKFHWYRTHPWGPADAQQYVNLLKASYTTVKGADPGAKVVLAALSIDSWKNLKRLYDWTDIEGRFDVAAIQAYAGTPAFLPTLMRNFRAALNAHGAVAAPIYVTEMTWPAACSTVKGKRTCRAKPGYTKGYMNGFLTDKAGQAKRLTNAYRILRDMRSELKLQRVYWYTGATAWKGINEFEYSGLLTLRNGNPQGMPSYTAYQSSARAAEGCAKNSNGVCK